MKIAEKEERKLTKEMEEIIHRFKKDMESKSEEVHDLETDSQSGKSKEKEKEVRTLRRNAKKWESEVVQLKAQLNVMINDKLLMVRTIRQLTGAMELLKRTQIEMGSGEKIDQIGEKNSFVKVKEDEEMVQPGIGMNERNVRSDGAEEKVLEEYHCIEDDDVILQYTKEEMEMCQSGKEGGDIENVPVEEEISLMAKGKEKEGKNGNRAEKVAGKVVENGANDQKTGEEDFDEEYFSDGGVSHGFTDTETRYESDGEKEKEANTDIKLPKKIVCPYYQKESGCWFGTRCRNLHSEEKVNKSEEKGRGDVRGQILCKFFMDRNCKFGEKCQYSHKPTADERKQHRQRKQNADGSWKVERTDGKKLCLFFMDKKCTFGKECRNSHEPTQEEKEEFQIRKESRRPGDRNNSKRTEDKRRDSNKKNKTTKPEIDKRSKDIDDEFDLGGLIDDFKQLSKEMHFLGGKIQKISRLRKK